MSSGQPVPQQHRSPSAIARAPRRRLVASASTLAVVAAGASLGLALPASATPDPCADGASPALLSTVSCSTAGAFTLTVPAGTTSVDLDVVGAGGGAGYPARAHIGGNAAEVTGTATLPAGTQFLLVRVGAAGTGDNHGTSTGGGASAVFAEDGGHALLAKIVIGAGGGGGAYNGNGGDAGSPGTSENNQAVSGPGNPGVGSTGGAGGTGNYAPGTAGGSNNPSALTVATGGNGGAVPGGATGGGGGGGYGGGGGGGGSRGSILSSNVAGGGGGSSLASAYLGSAAIFLKAGSGGVQLPGLVAGDGAVGQVTLTFDGLAVPGAPTGVTATPGDGQVSVDFTAPASDGGDPITSYTVTSSPDGLTTTCPGGPCVVTGLTDGTSYTFTVHATNANGDSPESSASTAVTPARAPGKPTGVTATAGPGRADVSFTAPASDGGSPITGYTVTSSPGGRTATCPGSPCRVPGLTDGTAYTFDVVATNGIGDSPHSTSSAAVTPLDVPGRPGDASAVPGDTEATVSFAAPDDDGGSPITAYTVTSSPGGLTSTCAGSPCVVTGLDNGTSYTFTVQATNAQGDSPASPASKAVTPASVPGAPTGVRAIAGGGSASVSFTAPGNDGGSPVTAYTVTSSPGGLTKTCLGSPCTIGGLHDGTAYTFTVHATSDVGDSVESAASEAVTPVDAPGAPQDVSVEPGDGAATVRFPAADDNGSAITGYQVSVDGGLTWVALSTEADHGALTGVVGGLTNGFEYDVRVRAVNAQGPGAASGTHHVTPATAPGAPTDVLAERGDGSASVSFQAPVSDGGSPVTTYTVTSHPGDRTATCVGSPCVVTGLTDGTSYTFTVHASSPAGDSAESTPSAAVIPSGPPAAPGSPVVVGTTSQTATLSFAAPATRGSSITGYEVSTDGGATWTAVTPLAVAGNLVAVVSGLAPGTSYAVSLRALNANGPGAASTPTNVATIPAAVAAPHAEAGVASAEVTWAASAGDTTTGYTVHAHPGPATCTTSARSATSCMIGATAGVSYTYTVVAHSPAGDAAASEPSGPVTATAPVVPAVAPADAPTTLTTTQGALASVRGGQHVTVVGTGFLPRSTVVVVIYSTPRVLGRFVTDGAGRARGPVTVPADLAGGQHDFVALGVDPAGSTVQLRMPVTRAAGQDGSWFHDPLTRAQRHRLVAVPAHPERTHGRPRLTRALYRTHAGRLAVPAAMARGHQLQRGQAVQLSHMFTYESTHLSAAGRREIHRLRSSLRSVHAVTCEGNADYAGRRSYEQQLSERRAQVICAALRRADPSLRTRAVGYGRSRPAELGGTAVRRQPNRRVVVLVRR